MGTQYKGYEKALNYIYDMAYIGTITTTEAMADITEELMEL